ncbi:MAG: methyl-accepting chemotaxis protein [Herbinix sp.]|nr:methyl-accepting chemotaxis protein [Herbinix sp.]
MKSLKSKMLLLLIPIVLVALGAVSAICYFFSRNIIIERTQEIMTQTSQANANKIDGWLTKQLEIIDSVKETIVTVDLDPEVEFNYLSHMVEKFESISDLYIGTVDGKMIDGAGWVPDPDYDPRIRSWYIEGIESDEIKFSTPYMDKAINQMVIPAVVKINNPDDSVRGVFAGDITLKTIIEVISKIKYGNTGYGYLVNNNDGTILAHYDSSYIMKNISEIENGKLKALGDKIKTGKSGSYIYESNGDRKIASFTPIASTNWSLAVVVSEKEVLSVLNKLAVNIIITLIISVLLIAFAIERASNYTITPIKRLSNNIKYIAKGDFTQEIDKKDLLRKDEIGAITHGISDMKNALRNLVISIKKESNYIEKDVQHVVGNVNELNDTVGDVSATTEELAAGMEETAASSQEMAATSQEIERAVQSIAKRSQEGAIAAGEISKRADNTKNNVNDSQKRAHETFVNTKQHLEQAMEDAKVVEEIEMLSDAIMQITEQTNLLSLNASIEAARAGEAGKGFSVVAGEIRKLADQSKNAVQKIQDMTTKVTGAVDRLSNCANDVLSFVSTNVASDYKVMLDVADYYNNDAKFVDDMVTEFSATAEELLASLENVLVAVDGVALAANEGAKGTTDIANRISETNLKANEVREIVNNTKESTNRLKSEIDKFKI